MIRSLPSAAALALAVLGATAVQAEPRQMPHQMDISVAGLDLANPADVQTLDHRIHAAAVDVCGTAQYKPGQGIVQFIEDRQTIAFCVWQAERGARRQLAGLRNPMPDNRLAAAGN